MGLFDAVSKAANKVKKGASAVGLKGHAEMFDVKKLAKDPGKWAADSVAGFKSDLSKGAVMAKAVQSGDMNTLTAMGSKNLSGFAAVAGVKVSAKDLKKTADLAVKANDLASGKTTITASVALNVFGKTDAGGASTNAGVASTKPKAPAANNKPGTSSAAAGESASDPAPRDNDVQVKANLVDAIANFIKSLFS